MTPPNRLRQPHCQYNFRLFLRRLHRRRRRHDMRQEHCLNCRRQHILEMVTPVKMRRQKNCRFHLFRHPRQIRQPRRFEYREIYIARRHHHLRR